MGQRDLVHTFAEHASLVDHDGGVRRGRRFEVDVVVMGGRFADRMGCVGVSVLMIVG